MIVDSHLATPLPRGAQVYRTGNTITTISGTPLAFGNSAVDAAEAFLTAYVGLLGVTRDELTEGSLAGDNAHTRGVMPVRDDAGKWTGQYKFTLVTYVQVRDGIPVYRGDLRVLVRNEPGFPVVLVRSGLRTIGTFRPDGVAAAAPNVGAAFAATMRQYPGIGDFTAPQLVIFAGDDVARLRAPVLGVVFQGTVGEAAQLGYGKFQVVGDAQTGQVVWSESLVYRTDVSGTITGKATTGFKSAECNPESSVPMPYARATIDSTFAYADAAGFFTVPNAGTTSVLVTGSLRGKYFNVYSPSTLEPGISVTVTPPGPANMEFNAANADTDQVRRAAVNAYLQANVVRDFALTYSPDFPVIKTQVDFRVNVAVSGSCNAFYDLTSINFFQSGGCANSAYGGVVHHEYGHHLVQSAGSGQLEYGEGTGDCMALLIADDPVQGLGFEGDCDAGIRTAENACQYFPGSCSTCGSEFHACGQLISGCVWSLRNELECADATGYRTTLADLVINAILVHTGTSIDAQICTDYLTLDDDNSNLGDGTPHSCQITSAFSAHGLAVYPGSIAFSYSSGRPTVISAGSGATVQVDVSSLCHSPASNTGTIYVDDDDNGSFAASSMSQVSTNHYDGDLPAVGCGSRIRYYFSVEDANGCVTTDPPGAPANYYAAFAADIDDVRFADDFESNQGWSTSATGGVTTGQWERAVPADTHGAAPFTDHDGSGKCYVTDNRSGSSAGSYDLDGGSVTLTSPTIDGSGPGEAYLSYSRWFSNSRGANPNDDTFVVEVSNNNGSSWTTLETVGPAVESNGGWVHKTFRLSETISPTSQVKVRFTASDASPASVVEAGVDAVRLEVGSCFCPSDFNQDGFVNGVDFDEFVAAFADGDPSADFDHNSFVNGVDFDGFVLAFNEGC